MIRALKVWRPEFVGTRSTNPFTVVTDHRPLEHFMTKRFLNQRQANWATILSEYNCKFTYRPGTENTIADALSRKAAELRTLKARQEEERTKTLFRQIKNNEFVTDNSQSTDESPIELLSLGFDDIPPLSGVILTESLLDMNRTNTDLEIYRDKARKNELHWTFLRDFVLYKGRLIVSAKNDLRTRIIEDLHTRILTCHPGRNKTRRLLCKKYWWPNMNGDIDVYVDNCSCKSSKIPRDKTPGLLRPLPLPLRPWHHVVVDFKYMPKAKDGSDNTFNIIDKLSKETWSTACKRSVTAKDAAWMFYKGPYRVHGLPQTVTSDRGPQFVADFSDEMCRILGIKWKLASAGHSQSAGQIENYHEWLDQRLRMFTNHYQDNWPEALPALGAAQACTPHDALEGLTPFEVSHGHPMPLPFDWENRTHDFKTLSAREKLSRKEAQDMAITLKQYHDAAREALKRTQHKMATQANKHRREPDFGVGDKVFIKKSWSPTDRPSDKLDFPLTRISYRIKSMKGYSYELDVPDTWRMSKVFHADRLRKDPDNPLPGQICDKPGPEIINDEEEWEVDRILSSRLHYHKLQYMAQWRGWDPDPEYYDAEGLKNSPAKIREFHEQNPNCEGPLVRLSDWETAFSQELQLPLSGY